MGRRPSRAHLAVSLFPFLSILACVIGVLTLMITALALGQINQKAVNQDEIDRAQESLLLTKTIAAAGVRSDALKATLARSLELQQATDAMLERRRALEEEKKKLEAPSLTAAQLQAQASQAKEKNDKMEAQLKGLLEELAPLREQAAKLPPKGSEGRITVRPGGTGVNLKPVFVECAGGGIIIHEPSGPVAIARAALAADAGFLALLTRVAEQEDATIIFLVRPDGIAVYNQARLIARQNHARNGKLPLPGDGPIDLSLFRGN